jgi:hypothetical protein
MFYERISNYLRGANKGSVPMEEPFTQQYWLDLPLRYPGTRPVKRQCFLWRQAAQQALEADGYGGWFKSGTLLSQPFDPWLFNELGVWGHAWLTSTRIGEIYISDGTAGQFYSNDEWQEGYYGKLSEAPDILRRIYISSLQHRF